MLIERNRGTAEFFFKKKKKKIIEETKEARFISNLEIKKEEHFYIALGNSFQAM